ncbi:HD domain-containing protein [bacterium]|nr:HD domain-containing protein [bacterium]
MNLVEKAKLFATKAHEGQVRKYTGEPYIIHPIEVSEIVERYNGSKEMIAAALLHDVVEDTDVTIEEIRNEFGNSVAMLVDDLTDVSKKEDGNRAVRKAMDREHTAKASAAAMVVKAADMISNGKDIKVNDPHFAKVYLKEMKALLNVMFKIKEMEIYKEAKGVVE